MACEAHYTNNVRKVERQSHGQRSAADFGVEIGGNYLPRLKMVQDKTPVEVLWCLSFIEILDHRNHIPGRS